MTWHDNVRDSNKAFSIELKYGQGGCRGTPSGPEPSCGLFGVQDVLFYVARSLSLSLSRSFCRMVDDGPVYLENRTNTKQDDSARAFLFLRKWLECAADVAGNRSPELPWSQLVVSYCPKEPCLVETRCEWTCIHKLLASGRSYGWKVEATGHSGCPQGFHQIHAFWFLLGDFCTLPQPLQICPEGMMLFVRSYQDNTEPSPTSLEFFIFFLVSNSAEEKLVKKSSVRVIWQRWCALPTMSSNLSSFFVTI